MSYEVSDPENEGVSLEFPDRGIALKYFKDYSFASNFLTPTDGWHFTTYPGGVNTNLFKSIGPGELVRLTVNGQTLATGYVDKKEFTAAKNSGTEVHIEGRDVLAQAVDSGAVPNMNLKEGSTFADAMKRIFQPYGWTEDFQFIFPEDVANDDVASMNGVRRSKKTGKPSRAFQLHQCQPIAHEGAYAFAARVSQRFGLWIWPSADGKRLFIDKPHFDQAPSFELRVNYSGTTNVLSTNVEFNVADQPTMIVVDGIGQTQSHGRYMMKAYALNPSVTVRGGGDPSLIPGGRAWKVDLPPQQQVMTVPFDRVMYVLDECSTDLDQLKNLLKREMAHKQHSALSVQCTTAGHGQIVDGVFTPWDVDTVVTYRDEISGLEENLYVLGRTFHKSRSGGTTTDLELIRLNSLAF